MHPRHVSAVRLIALFGLMLALWGSLPVAHARTTASLNPVRLTDQNVRPDDAVAMNGTLYFFSYDFDQALWKSDGTPAGTVQIRRFAQQAAVHPQLVPPSDIPIPRQLTVVNNTLFFVQADAEHGYELWKSDGTTEGTALFKDIAAGPDSSEPMNLTNLNGTLLFFATSPTSTGKRQLWRSDGTAAGTVPLAGFETKLLNPYTFVVGKTMFFTDENRYLWKTDGTEQGTALVSNTISVDGNFAAAQNTLYFSASDPQHGTELWKSDGTPAGTTLVRDILPGNEGSAPISLVTLNQYVFFMTHSASGAYELWQSDGTEAGTTKVVDMLCSPGLAALNGKVFFGASDAEYGCELWQTDGTPGGTMLFMDIEPGAGNGNPIYLTAVDRTLVFSKGDKNYLPDGLWVSNGTPEGTAQVGQFVAIQDKPLVVAGEHLFFVSQNDLWAVIPPEAPSYAVYLPLTLR